MLQNDTKHITEKEKKIVHNITKLTMLIPHLILIAPLISYTNLAGIYL